jgi:PmbA protein
MHPPVDPNTVVTMFHEAIDDAGDVDHLELCLLGRAAEYTRFAGERIHQPQNVTETQYLVRAVVDGRAGRATTAVLGDLCPTVRLAAAAARRAVRAAGSGTVTLAAPDDDACDLPLWFDDVSAFDTATRTRTASDTMHRALAAGASAAGMLGRAVTQQVVISTTGVQRSAVATEAQASVTVRAGDGSAHWVDVGRSVDRLGMDEALAATVAVADTARRPVPVPAREYTVVLGAEAVCELVQFLPAFGFSGDLAAAGIGLYATSPGRRVAAAVVDVADDATTAIGLPIGFDIEGCIKRRVPFLDAGVVGTPVTDLATARLLGSASTGHAHMAREEPPAPAAANIVMAAGTAGECDLIAGVDDGVYVQRFWYTRVVDAARGTITGVTRDACFRIRGGALAEPIAGMRFTQSVLDVLAATDDVGRQRRSSPIMNVWNSAATAPALRSHGFRFGSRQESSS